MNRTIFSVSGLVTFAMLASSCGVALVTMALINAAKDSSHSSLTTVNTKVDETIAEVSSAYKKLSVFVDSRYLTNSDIMILEENLTTIKLQYSSLMYAFHQSQSDGDVLFEMLTRRAEENQTQSFKNKMTRDISLKHRRFESKMSKADRLIYKIGKSVQKYDDIVGYCQVNKGLEGVDLIIAELESTERVGAQLNKEIRDYINEGLRIIESIE